MILELYIFMYVLAFGLLFYGWQVQHDLYRIIAMTLIFILGGMLSPAIPTLAGDIEYKSGEVDVISGNTTTTSYNYATYTNHTLGFFISIMAILGLVLIMMDRRTN